MDGVDEKIFLILSDWSIKDTKRWIDRKSRSIWTPTKFDFEFLQGAAKSQGGKNEILELQSLVNRDI